MQWENFPNLSRHRVQQLDQEEKHAACSKPRPPKPPCATSKTSVTVGKERKSSKSSSPSLLRNKACWRNQSHYFVLTRKHNTSRVSHQRGSRTSWLSKWSRTTAKMSGETPNPSLLRRSWRPNGCAKKSMYELTHLWQLVLCKCVSALSVKPGIVHTYSERAVLAMGSICAVDI